MVKRTYNNIGDNEPEQKKFDIPSEKEHLFQVVDVFTFQDEMGVKLGLDENTVTAKLEVCGGEEEGRTLLQRCTLDENAKGFFATRLLLKACGLSYKGAGLNIDTDQWIGKQFFATVIHNKGYANIKEFNFDKPIETPVVATASDDISWDLDPNAKS